MIASIRKFIVLAIVLLCTFSMFSQEEYLISQGGTITTCSGVLYDSGGADGNYDNNEDYTITIVSEDSETNIRLFFTEFNFESATFDNLSIYDGESIASPSIIAPSGSTNLLGQEIVASGNSITLVMHTDGSVTYPGFAASISCSYSCQDYEIDIVNTDPEITNLDSMWVDICHGESILMVGNAVFPNNDIVYHQSLENLYYIWQFVTEDYEEIYEGEGLFNPEVVLEQSGGYSVHLTTIDSNGCVEHFDDNLRIRTSLRPDFSEIIIDEGICLGEQLVLNGAFIQDTFNVNPVLGNSYPICFEDVVGVWQSTCFTFYSFAKNAIITSPEDIISVCMNMEHSYMGDLDIELECPNGQSITLYEQVCGSSYFGEPDHADDCNPGIGYDYCWSSNATAVVSDSCASGSTLPAGEYLSVESFEGLVGCPVAGEWCINFLDNLGLDDGNVFSSVINLADGVSESGSWEYTNTYDTSEDSQDIGWSGYGVDSEFGDSTYAIISESGDYTYTFSVIDDWGCTHDTSFNVTVYEVDDPFCSMFCNETTCTNLTDTINDGSGDDYPSQNNSECSWLISPGSKSGNAIFMRWHYFDLYPNDILILYDGNSEFAPVIGEFTFGSELPVSMISSGNEVYITYVTDSYNRSPGWSIIYETVLVNNEQENTSNISVFPNPASDMLNISGMQTDSDIIIYDLSGKELINQTAFSGGSIDISKLASGVYFVGIQNEREAEMIRFVKQ